MSSYSELSEAFRRHYEAEDSHWGGHSGDGSLPYWTIEYRAFLERFIHLNAIKSVVDIGCGDWQFSRLINWTGVRYHGFDVVPSVVERNRHRFGNELISFDLMPQDLSQVPSADLLIMKDVLQHLPDREILRHRDSLFGRYPRCLLTNSFNKLDTARNIDIAFGDFRCLDLNAAPYDFGGQYVLEFSSPIWEQIRVMLYTPGR
nr:methyltransferase domain-containing protein [Sphingomonas sp. Y57]